MKEVIPLAVETITETMPNIYKRAICNSKIITLDDDVSNEVNIGDKIKRAWCNVLLRLPKK